MPALSAESVWRALTRIAVHLLVLDAWLCGILGASLPHWLIDAESSTVSGLFLECWRSDGAFECALDYTSWQMTVLLLQLIGGATGLASSLLLYDQQCESLAPMSLSAAIICQLVSLLVYYCSAPASSHVGLSLVHVSHSTSLP